MRVTLSSPRTGIAYLPGLAAPQSLDLDKVPEPIAREIQACLAALASEDPRVPEAGLLRDDVHHSVVVEQPDGTVSKIEGPPTGAMGKLVTAIRAGIRAAARED
jgi:hypothetical protein